MKQAYIRRYNDCNRQAGTSVMQMIDFTAECVPQPELA